MKEGGVIMKWQKRKASRPRHEGYTDFSFIEDGMEFVSDVEAKEYFTEEPDEIISQTSHNLNEQND